MPGRGRKGGNHFGKIYQMELLYHVRMRGDRIYLRIVHRHASARHLSCDGGRGHCHCGHAVRARGRGRIHRRGGGPFGGSSYNADLTIAGIVPVKTVRAQVVERRVVQVCGTPFGIKMFANGAMVVGFSDIYTSTGYQNPAKTAGLRMGDVITSIAGRDTKTNEDVAAALQGLAGAPAEVVYVRDGVEKSVLLTAVKDSTTDSWRTGMWVRDSSAGIGTLTFVDNTTGTFAGLGHSIHDVDTGTTISLLKGEIVPVEITGAVAGSAGSPGELKGRFLTSVPTGTITVNGETGVYGSVKSYMKGIEAEVALAQEVNTGDAEIITTIEGQEPKRYTAVIEKIALSSDNPNRNMVVRVTDPACSPPQAASCRA